MDILLHACCAPCLIKTAETFSNEGFSPHIFWYNPNIHPYREYLRRREALGQYLEKAKYPLNDRDIYDLNLFFRSVKDDSDRCPSCYRLRLLATAQKALELGIPAFSTSLVISPYQKHELLAEEGRKIGASVGVEFVYRDLRQYFHQGRAIAREMGLYVQPYCGCIFSEYERYYKKGVSQR
jgi:predicted adenine nucleotide alpha hydrolase (AANH) superfamily ATPase